MGDRVNHPDHYNRGRFEVIDVIEDWNLGFNLGNAVKYLARAQHKGELVVDLKKAVWYIEREIRNSQIAPTPIPKSEIEDALERSSGGSGYIPPKYGPGM
jgi:hypothetical protein